MNISKNSRLYAYLAAVCYIVSAIYCIVVNIIESTDSDGLNFNTIVYIIICIIFSVALLLRNEKILLAIMAFNVLYILYCLIDFFYIGNLFDFAASVLLLVVALAILMDKSGLQRFWYLPAILSLFSYIAGILRTCHLLMKVYPSVYPSVGAVLKSDFISFERVLLYGIVPAVAYALVGLWLKVADHSPTSNPVKAAPAASPSHPSQAETIERLKEYKSLLDCGAITEEEFQEKKKNLLGL